MDAYVNLRGERVDLNEIAQKHKPIPKSAPDSLKRTTGRHHAKKSDGFVVLGFSPDHLLMAKADHEAEIASVNEHNERERHKASPQFKRVPDLWEEQRYMLKTKPKRVRSKPYELAEAADLCADMARKAGWLCVNVEELMKG